MFLATVSTGNYDFSVNGMTLLLSHFVLTVS